MAEVTIADLTKTISKQSEDSKKRDDAQLKELASINKHFSDYFKAQKLASGDKEEERRDAKRKEAPETKGVGKFSDARKGLSGLGFMGAIGATLAAITGLVTGLFDGIKDSVRFINDIIPVKLKESINNLRKSILKRFNVLSDKFSKTISKPISTFFTNLKTSFTTKILDPLTKGFNKNINIFRKTFTTKILDPLTKGFNKIIDPFKKIFAAIDDIARKAPSGKFLKGNTIKVFGRLTPILVSLTRGVSSFTEAMKTIPELASKSKALKGQIKNLKDMFSSFTGVAKGAKEVAGAAKNGAGIFSKLKPFIRPFFDIFRRVGRFLGGPITVALFTIVDGFIGAFKGFTETEGGIFAKITGAIIGAISGMISGFVGGLLDLGKMIVGWIAGLFGFGAFKEKLAELSFTDMIFDGLMWPFRALMSLFDGKEGNMFTDLYKKIKETISNFFLEMKEFIVEGIKSLNPFSDDGDSKDSNKSVRQTRNRKISVAVPEEGRSTSGNIRKLRNGIRDNEVRSQTASNVVIQDNSTTSAPAAPQQMAVLPGGSSPLDPFEGTRGCT